MYKSLTSFLTSLFSSKLSLDHEPLSSTQMKKIGFARKIVGLLLIFFALAAFWPLSQILPPAGSILISAIVTFPLFALFAGMWLIIEDLDEGHLPMTDSMCLPLLDACVNFPSIAQYRDKVLAQNRTFTQAEYNMLMLETKRLDPKTLHYEAIKKAACKALHGIA